MASSIRTSPPRQIAATVCPLSQSRRHQRETEAEMHETVIVEALLRILVQKASQNHIDRIVSVRLKVGRLRGLDPRQIRGCFEIFAEDSLAQGARLDIDEIPIVACCRGCGRGWEVSGYRFQCPTCRSTQADITQGRELYIDSFEGRSAEKAEECAPPPADAESVQPASAPPGRLATDPRRTPNSPGGDVRAE